MNLTTVYDGVAEPARAELDSKDKSVYFYHGPRYSRLDKAHDS